MGERAAGVDFDNTVVSYDEVLGRIARERGLLNSNGPAAKRTIRDEIRLLPDGEIEWQKCQALLYGPRIHEARLIAGVEDFFQRCREQGIDTYIISHKTEYSRYDATGTNLREAALGWMREKGFFDPSGLGLTPERVFFANTRQEKIAHLTRLRCTEFIDDLEETFLEETFPAGTARLLYEPARTSPPPSGVRLMKSWQEISDYFFGRN